MTENESWLMSEFRKMRNARNQLIGLVIGLLMAMAFALSVAASNAETVDADRAFTGRAYFVQGTSFVIECETEMVINEINPRTILIGCSDEISITDDLTK